jgi:hypothetical protein
MPKFLPDTLTKASATDMYAALAAAWEEMFDSEPKRESLLLLLAHWDLETGAGTSMHCWNVGNSKSVEGDGYDWTHFRCWEKIGNKKVWFDPPHPQTRFRAFHTLQDGVSDYLKMLNKRFHMSWSAVQAGDPEAFARLLKKQRYYTADENEYARVMWQRFNAYVKKIPFATAPDVIRTSKEVQQGLIALGYYLGPEGADGYIGPRTRDAIVAFQKTMGLVPDGVAGPKTKAKLLGAWQAYSGQ